MDTVHRVGLCFCAQLSGHIPSHPKPPPNTTSHNSIDRKPQLDQSKPLCGSQSATGPSLLRQAHTPTSILPSRSKRLRKIRGRAGGAPSHDRRRAGGGGYDGTPRGGMQWRDQRVSNSLDRLGCVRRRVGVAPRQPPAPSACRPLLADQRSRGRALLWRDVQWSCRRVAVSQEGGGPRAGACVAFASWPAAAASACCLCIRIHRPIQSSSDLPSHAPPRTQQDRLSPRGNRTTPPRLLLLRPVGTRRGGVRVARTTDPDTGAGCCCWALAI